MNVKKKKKKRADPLLKDKDNWKVYYKLPISDQDFVMHYRSKYVDCINKY